MRHPRWSLGTPLICSLGLMGALSFILCSTRPGELSRDIAAAVLGGKLTFVSITAALGFQQYAYFRHEAVKQEVSGWVVPFFTEALSLHFATAAPILISLGVDLWTMLYGSRPALSAVSYAGVGAALVSFCCQVVVYFLNLRAELRDAKTRTPPN